MGSKMRRFNTIRKFPAKISQLLKKEECSFVFYSMPRLKIIVKKKDGTSKLPTAPFTITRTRKELGELDLDSFETIYLGNKPTDESPIFACIVEEEKKKLIEGDEIDSRSLLAMLPKEESEIVLFGNSIINWLRDHKFC